MRKFGTFKPWTSRNCATGTLRIPWKCSARLRWYQPAHVTYQLNFRKSNFILYVHAVLNARYCTWTEVVMICFVPKVLSEWRRLVHLKFKRKSENIVVAPMMLYSTINRLDYWLYRISCIFPPLGFQIKFKRNRTRTRTPPQTTFWLFENYFPFPIICRTAFPSRIRAGDCTTWCISIFKGEILSTSRDHNWTMTKL